jgi:hypothetical protein
MRIAYIILTCKKYLTTRVEYQKRSFLTHVLPNDIYFLSGQPDEKNKIYGWNTPDEYEKLPLKNIYFFKNMKLDYDWFVFMDDDTFVFPNRLEEFLKKYNATQSIWIGCILDHIQHSHCSYMSGGAGSVMSRSLYNLVYEYVQTQPMEKVHCHWCDDVCKGLWIKDIQHIHDILFIHNSHFHCNMHTSEECELLQTITYHHLLTSEDYNFYNNILNKETTAFVLLSDEKYKDRVIRTIEDIRTVGMWQGDIVLICVQENLQARVFMDSQFIEKHNITTVSFPIINKVKLLNDIGNGFSNSDGREVCKIMQWEKIHVFDNFFTRWKRIVYLDAGLRILDNVNSLLELNYRDVILAPNDAGDGPDKNSNVFECQLSKDNPDVFQQLITMYGQEILKKHYFLNCIWIYDTNISKKTNIKKELIKTMNVYPIFKTNEMGAMNIVLHFQHKLWCPFPWKTSQEKYLFDWCELNHKGTHWKQYCAIKYPVTIGFGENPY